VTLREIGTECLRARAEVSRLETLRDQLIRQAAAEGMSLRRIADDAGVSFQRVAQILNQESKES
jgi:transcriptional regulator with XRE-family HTH domain